MECHKEIKNIKELKTGKHVSENKQMFINCL